MGLLLGAALAQAQTLRVSGTVTGAEDGMPIPGVSVIVKGTTIGTATDMDGKYTLNVPSDAQTLVFSYIGYATQEVALAGRTNGASIDVAMASASEDIEEVVVTALGISREKKSLGYAVSEVDGEALSNVRTQNVISSLSGRVAGVQITTASGQMGGGAKINVRGNTSLTGNNQPLFVVDGVPISNADYSYGANGSGGYDLGNLGGDINSDDVESISILKGASATALYGSRAANGVVMITTKKAAMGLSDNFGVSVNSSIIFDKAAYYPKHQKLYGVNLYKMTIAGKEYMVPGFNTDESWGDAFDANVKTLRWNSFDEWDKENYMVEKPWVYPEHDYTYYFKTGRTIQNNVALQGSGTNYSYRLSYTNMDVTGITPGSTLKRNTINLTSQAKLNKWFDAWMNVSYVQTLAKGRPETGYGDRNAAQKMWQWTQVGLDYKDLETYKNPDGTQRTWNRKGWDDATPEYTDNPYWMAFENYENDRRDRVYGNTGVNMTILPWLKLTGRLGIDFFRTSFEERIAHGSQADTYYELQLRSVMETNSDLFLTIDKRLADDQLGLTAVLGASRMDYKYWLNGGYSSGGLVLPNFYHLSNSLNTAIPYHTNRWKRINSLFANVSLDWNRQIYLELTGRKDWSSTLPADNRSYFYPSATLSVILSEFDFLRDNSIVSFAKVRGGIAQVGNDTDPYQLVNEPTSTTAFGGHPRQYYSTTNKLSTLLPEKTTSWEIGAEVKFLNNRLGIDLSYFYKATTNQIIPIDVSRTTGYSYSYINAGKMSNRGVELAISATPVSVGGFTWDIGLNMATLNNKVDELTDGVDFVSLGSAPFRVKTGAFVGHSYPVIYGYDYLTDDQGNRLLSNTGRYRTTKDLQPLANATPTFTAGLNNTFAFKGLELNVLIDMQRGGHMFYTSYMWGMYSGILEESAVTNENGKNIRDAVADGGGVLLDGVYGNKSADGKVTYYDADGNVSSTPVKNTKRIKATTYGADHYSGPDRQNIFSTDFIKLREVRLSYTIPARFTGPIKDVKISAFGRNLALWGAATKHFDPEYLQMAGSNVQGIEGGYQPSTRSFGVGLNFNF